jgi:ribosomal protein S18 acetylase RimI-like enzyme
VTRAEEPRLADVNPEERSSLEPILEEGFEGWYLRHSKSTLYEIGRVRAAMVGGRSVGLAMLKTVGDGVGYVYYIAVARAFRRRGVGRMLLEDALAYFSGIGARVVYASVENDEGASLFLSKGFRKTGFGEVSKKYGLMRAISMYRSMLAVPGEVLLQANLAQDNGAPNPSSRA